MNQRQHRVRLMCRVLEVSPSGYYAWRRRESSARERSDADLLQKIAQIHHRSRGTYGVPRIHAQLASEGQFVGRKRIARLMQKAGLKGVYRRQWPRTTLRSPQDRPAPDLVDRHFSAAAPDQLWVADITYVPTASGFLYLLDVFSRRVVGWSMKTHLRSELVLDAPRTASSITRIKGSQYTGLEFGSRCLRAGVRPSIGSVGDCYDNALCESFFATLECELIDRTRFQNPDQARREVFDFIEGFYNPHRLHSALGYHSPINFERNHTEVQSIPNS